MRKARLFAATLAAVSVMSLTVPAFAEELNAADGTNIESTVASADDENTSDTEPDNMDTTETTTDENGAVPEENNNDESAETSESTTVDVTEENTEPTQEISEINNNAVSLAEQSGTKIYSNDQGQKVFEADNAVAYVNPDGQSGRIYINQDKINKTPNDYGIIRYTIDKVGDVPLRYIMKFNDGGYVSAVNGSIEASEFFDDQIEITARGPEFGGGSGNFSFKDNTGDTYSKTICKHAEDKHVIHYNSEDPYVKFIDWYSYSSDNKEFPDYEFKKDSTQSSENKQVYVNSEGQTVYESGWITAYVNPDGISSHINIDTFAISYMDKNDYANMPAYAKEWDITEIGNVKLTDIIKFNDHGYVSKIIVRSFPNQKLMKITANGSGPSGLFHGSGVLKFTPETGESDELTLWSHTFNVHDLKLNTQELGPKTIEWYCI